jgi:hypothetical protein
MNDLNPDLKLLLEGVIIKDVTISVTMRRSYRASTSRGDEYRTAEASESMTISHGAKDLTPQDAHQLAMALTPDLVKKVLFDLVVLGTMTKEEASRRLAFAKANYLSVGKVTDVDKGRNSADLPRTGDTDNPSGEESPEGVGVSSGEDGGLPPDAGPGSRPSFEG